MKFFVRYRTQLSQLWGITFLTLFALSGKILVTASPLWQEMLFVIGCVLVGLATVGRLWCAQYIAGYKLDKLVTQGPYSVCRHPLYLFSFLGAVGIGCCTETVTLMLLTAFSFVLVYPSVIASEERDLMARFGDDYRKYMAEVPAFFPRFSLFHEPQEYIVVPRVFRREIFDAIWFVWLAGILELIEVLEQADFFPKLFWLY